MLDSLSTWHLSSQSSKRKHQRRRKNHKPPHHQSNSPHQSPTAKYYSKPPNRILTPQPSKKNPTTDVYFSQILAAPSPFPPSRSRTKKPPSLQIRPCAFLFKKKPPAPFPPPFSLSLSLPTLPNSLPNSLSTLSSLLSPYLSHHHHYRSTPIFQLQHPSDPSSPSSCLRNKLIFLSFAASLGLWMSRATGGGFFGGVGEIIAFWASLIGFVTAWFGRKGKKIK